MTIYEINTRLARFLEENFDPETGEILNLDKLSELEMLKEEKIENIALYYKNTVAMAKAIKEERQALADRQAKLEKKAESLQRLLEWATEGEKFETGKVSVSYRKSEKVVIDDLEKLPEEYVRTKVTREADKTNIKKALKEGIEIEGCRLEEGRNIQVK